MQSWAIGLPQASCIVCMAVGRVCRGGGGHLLCGGCACVVCALRCYLYNVCVCQSTGFLHSSCALCSVQCGGGGKLCRWAELHAHNSQAAVCLELDARIEFLLLGRAAGLHCCSHMSCPACCEACCEVHDIPAVQPDLFQTTSWRCCARPCSSGCRAGSCRTA